MELSDRRHHRRDRWRLHRGHHLRPERRSELGARPRTWKATSSPNPSSTGRLPSVGHLESCTISRSPPLFLAIPPSRPPAPRHPPPTPRTTDTSSTDTSTSATDTSSTDTSSTDTSTSATDTSTTDTSSPTARHPTTDTLDHRHVVDRHLDIRHRHLHDRQLDHNTSSTDLSISATTSTTTRPGTTTSEVSTSGTTSNAGAVVTTTDGGLAGAVGKWVGDRCRGACQYRNRRDPRAVCGNRARCRRHRVAHRRTSSRPSPALTAAGRPRTRIRSPLSRMLRGWRCTHYPMFQN